MVSLMIGIDSQKFSVTALAINAIEELLGGRRVRVSGSQAERLLGWAAARPERIWGKKAPTEWVICWLGSSWRLGSRWP